MRIFYSILDALSFLKKEIERLEKKMKEEKNRYYRHEIESLIEWNLERGLAIIKMTSPDEANQDVIDYFLGKKKKRPDLLKLEELMGEGMQEKE